MLLPGNVLGELKPPPSLQSQAGEEPAGVVHAQICSRHHFHTLGHHCSATPWLGLPRLIGTVVSTPGWSQLVMGQLLGDTDCWPWVTSMPFVKDLSLALRNAKWVPLKYGRLKCDTSIWRSWHFCKPPTGV